MTKVVFGHLKIESSMRLFFYYSPLCVRDWSGILCEATSKDIAESPTAEP